MTTSPDLGLPFIDGQQFQPEVTHNEALLLLQAMINGVVDRGVNTPAVSPTIGDSYVLGSSPTGAWAGRASCVAIWSGTAWDFIPGEDSAGTPITMGARQEGMRVWVRDEDTTYVWSGATWVAQYLTGSATYDAPSIAVAGTTTTTVTVTGAALGDFALASFSLTVAGLAVTAYVSAADTVTVVLYNPTGAPIDLGSATLRARVFKV